MNALRKSLQALLVIAVLAAGAGVFKLLVDTKPVAERKPREQLGTLVEVQEVSRKSHQVKIPAQGTVQAAEQVNLAPEVGGRIVWRHPQLVPGGIVKEGDVLVRLDAKAYRLQAAQQEAQVDRARMELELERGRKSVAEREWEMLQQQPSTKIDVDDPALALREPQLKSAEVSVEAARSALEAAKLNVSRTVLRAPFNAFVQTAMADPGQLVNAHASVASLVGTDAFWVQVSIPVENLAWLKIPGIRGEKGAPATITQDIGASHIEREGRVLRLLGDLDPVGRMARVLVEIEDPFNLQGEDEREAGELPLLVGAFVDVSIDAGTIEDVIEIPRRAVRDGDRAFVYADDRTLDMRQLDITWRTDDSVLVKSGLESGDKVVVSRLSTPVEGMLLRLPRDESDEEPEKQAKAQARANTPPADAVTD